MDSETDSHEYDDIINLPHHTSSNRPRMSVIDRAAQFSPFAALTGYEDAVKEAARLTGKRMELDEYEKASLDQSLHQILAHLEEHPEAAVTYFQPDERKEGGAYLSVTGRIKKIDSCERCLIMMDGKKIPLDDIAALDEVQREGLPSSLE